MISIDWLNLMFYERTMHTVFYILLVDKHNYHAAQYGRAQY